jgi:hypothetical protein
MDVGKTSDHNVLQVETVEIELFSAEGIISMEVWGSNTDLQSRRSQDGVEATKPTQ